MSDIIKAGILPVAIEFMDRPCIRATEAFAGAGYPDCEALLIVEVEGSEEEIDAQLARIMAIARRHNPVELRESGSPEESAKIWLGRKSAFGAMGQINDICVLMARSRSRSFPMFCVGSGRCRKTTVLMWAMCFMPGMAICTR